MRSSLRHLQRRAKRRRATDEEKEQALDYGRKCHKETRRAKLEHWREWLEDAIKQSIWTANRYASRDRAGGPLRIPTLVAGDTEAVTTAQKADVLRATFSPPQVSLDDIAGYE